VAAGAVSGADGNGKADQPATNGAATMSGNGASEKIGDAGACRAQGSADEKRTHAEST
jgi:hypothetical protein